MVVNTGYLARRTDLGCILIVSAFIVPMQAAIGLELASVAIGDDAPMDALAERVSVT